MEEFLFIFNRIKKRRGPGKRKCHTKTMMNTKVNERIKMNTQLHF